MAARRRGDSAGRPGAGRLFRSRPGATRWQNPLAEKDGQPGVVFRWMEVEGPIYDEWPTAGHKLLFADLPMVNRKVETNAMTMARGGGGRRRFAETNRFDQEVFGNTNRFRFERFVP